MVDKDGNAVDIVGELEKLESQMTSYIDEIEDLLIGLRKVDSERERLTEDFNIMTPKAVKIQRRKRQSERKKVNQNLKRPAMLFKTRTTMRGSVVEPAEETKSEPAEKMDDYEMISVNCRFKKPVKALTDKLKALIKQRKDLEEKYSKMRIEVFKIKQIKLYKPVKGDAVDEMFAGYLNEAKLAIEVERISANNYMFGTKKILAKIINNRLVIRVGGGYMNAEEFIEQYGRIEMLKKMKQEGDRTGETDLQVQISNAPGASSTKGSEAAKRMTMMLGNNFKEEMRKKMS